MLGTATDDSKVKYLIDPVSSMLTVTRVLFEVVADKASPLSVGAVASSVVKETVMSEPLLFALSTATR